ncbi:MAG TPA: exonuclease domain-containing protein [Burkholderiales bacterium]|jgi:DNA polymerase-3 subunit epsilon|nr:exonuclease domain-containing protein [Burkholderiales bacterium]
MFSPYTVFLDLETTGLSPREDGITEIGVVMLRPGEEPREWSTLVKPAMSIPPEIAAMTGITNEMVRGAPRFAEVADTLAELLEGAVLVAHNARFDYAFLKQAYAREGYAFFVPTLCTARLARELEPDLEHAGLDALSERYRLGNADRHRALGDARLTHALAQAMARKFDSVDVEAAVKRVLRRPSLPKHLPVDTLVNIPDGPGVYLFYGLNQHPLYIGKAKSLRERVGGHFSGDWMSERGARLSEELRRIEWVETAGELSALLLEAELIRDRLPSHNVLLRRRTEPVAIVLNHEVRGVEYRKASGLAHTDLEDLHGPYSSRASARSTLTALADEYHLCLKTLGLERKRKDEVPQTSCFAWQVNRCLGACCGEESAEAHWDRVVEALGPARMPPWPHEGPVELIECDPASGREARFVVDRWCLVSPAGAVQEFDREIFRVLRPYIEGRKRKSAVIVRVLEATA